MELAKWVLGAIRLRPLRNPAETHPADDHRPAVTTAKTRSVGPDRVRERRPAQVEGGDAAEEVELVVCIACVRIPIAF
jgi:hypothetical protein